MQPKQYVNHPLPVVSDAMGTMLEDQVRTTMAVFGAKLLGPDMLFRDMDVAFVWPSNVPMVIFNDTVQDQGTPPYISISMSADRSFSGTELVRGVEVSALYPIPFEEWRASEGERFKQFIIVSYNSTDAVALEWIYQQPHALTNDTIGVLVSLLQLALAAS